MKTLVCSMHRNFVGLLIFIGALALGSQAYAAPTIISPPPTNGVSPSAPLVFTFSEAMDTDPMVTGVDFIDLTTFATLPTIAVWSGGDTILTCTPSPSFPTNRQIAWSAYGANPVGDPLGGIPGGLFTTGSGSGSGGGGSGTNAITTFSVGKVHHYNQTSGGSPTLDPTTPYGFSGVTSLSSNRTATSVALTLPTATVSNLTHLPPPSAEIFILSAVDTNLNTYEATFPSGNYSFFVQAASSNQTVVVNLPTTNIMAQPGAPHLTNYPAAQAVNPGQAFALGWDAFPGGTAADYIYVQIGANYSSPNPGTPGALSGTARTFTIPAGTLQPNSTYDSTIGFYRRVGTTNASFATDAYRATFTDFSFITTSGSQLVLTNASWTPGSFSFDVICTNGQTVTVEYTNVLTAVNWPKLLTTNSPGSRFHVVSPQAVSNKFLYYRARNGP